MATMYIETDTARLALLVWGGMLVTGFGAWLGSGTPFAGAAIVVAVLLAAASPAGALCATCAAIPLIFHPIEVGALQLGLLELGILATATGTGFRFLFDLVSGGGASYQGALQPWTTWLLVGLLAFVGTLSVAWMPFATHRAEALRSWRWIIVEPLIVFLLARLAIARVGRPMLILAIAAPAAIVAAAALWQQVDPGTEFSVDAVHRSTATYLHPNNLALYLERAFFLIAVPAISIRGRFRWVLAVLAGIMALGIVTTFSRGAFLGFAVGGAVLLAAHPIHRGWSILGFGLAGLGTAFGLIATQRLTGSGSSGFVAVRGLLWKDAARMLRDFPLTGIGLDQFLWLHRQRYIDPRIWDERYTSHPHNLLLDSWLSLGIAGFLSLALFIALGGWVIWQARRGRRTVDPWQLGALASIGAGLGHGLVDNGYFLPDLAVMTWLNIALLTTCVTVVDLLSGGTDHA